MHDKHPSIGTRLANYATIVCGLCAMLMTGILATRQFTAAPGRQQMTSLPKRIPDSTWNRMRALGHRLGDSVQTSARVEIVEFADYQCPACKAWEGRLKEIQAQANGKIRLTYRHLPIPRHSMAAIAAQASECAADQGRFQQFHHILFQRQDSIPLIPLADFARRADVGNVKQFAACMQNADKALIVKRDLADARAFGATATPAFVINGWYWVHPPTAGQLDSLVQAYAGR